MTNGTLDDLDRTVKRFSREDVSRSRYLSRLRPDLSGESTAAGGSVSGVLAAGPATVVDG